MRDLIDTWSTPCDFAALFGSAATGRMTEGSDIDVFVVRPDSVVVEDDVQWHEQLDALATASTSWTGNDARVLEMSASEVADTIAYCCSVEGAAVNGMVVPVPSGAA